MKKPSVLPPGIRLHGEIEGEGDLIVFGLVEGPIRVGGALVIEAGGLVRGHVHARQITIRGALKGDAFADEGIRADASARIVGDLTAPRVRVTPGAQFAGQVHVEALEAAPPLQTYDPALHTFTGLPAPGPIPESLSEGVSIEGAPRFDDEPIAESDEIDLDDTTRFTPLTEEELAAASPPRERPSRTRAAAAPSVGATPPSKTTADEGRPTDSRALTPQPEAPKRVGRMPRIGRVKGSHRPRG